MSLFVLDDMFGPKLWGENAYRRLLHHVSGWDYNELKEPLVHRVPDIINKDQVQSALTIFDNHMVDKHTSSNCFENVARNLGGANVSTKLYADAFSETELTTLLHIGEQLIPTFNQILGEELILGDSNFKCCILSYSGESSFNMHYDTESPDCFRTIIMIHKKGDVAKFTYHDADGTPVEVDMDPGSGILQRGTTTYHGVPATTDPNAERVILGFQYMKVGGVPEPQTLCSETRHLSTGKIVSEIMVPWGIYYTCLHAIQGRVFSGKVVTFQQSVMCAFIISFIYSNISTKLRVVGSGYPGTTGSLSRYAIACFLGTFNPHHAIDRYIYTLVTEMLLPNDNTPSILETIDTMVGRE